MNLSKKYLGKLSSVSGYYYDIEKFAIDNGMDINVLPYSIRILLENTLRSESKHGSFVKAAKLLNWKNNINEELEFYPARILLQDYTGVPCLVDLASMRDAVKKLGKNPSVINPIIPVDLVIDHSVQIDQYGSLSALTFNIEREFERNFERYRFMKWAQTSFNNLRVIPPDRGIIHQINIEYLSNVVENNEDIYYPDSVFGTDSHTTMINGMGVLGWGVGGIEAEACMLGEPSVFPIPKVIGVKLLNHLPSGVVATDLALFLTNILRKYNVVGKFVEYFGEGLKSLTLSDRVTISNMAPEYGSTCGFVPIDYETLEYLKLTGRTEENINLVHEYVLKNKLFYNEDEADNISYSQIIEVDLLKVSSSLSGPKRPQDKISLNEVSLSFVNSITNPLGHNGYGLNMEDTLKYHRFELEGSEEILNTGDVLIAAITSCTNTSNPYVLIGAGLLAKKAVEKGLTVNRKVKTSFAPGSRVVTRYLENSGLLPYLEILGFNVVAYGCTTCIGNSGPLRNEIEIALKDSNIIAGAVLSGNRNFEGRIHPQIKANYLASPILVVAYALAGNLKINLQSDIIGIDNSGKNVYLEEIWPSSNEIELYVRKYVTTEVFDKTYKDIFKGSLDWDKIQVVESPTYDWQIESTYIANPPYFDKQINKIQEKINLKSMKVLAMVGDSITTDHISPAGNIDLNSPAGMFLIEKGVVERNFNSYGSRRGHHEVMTRGTFANTRLQNKLLSNTIGGFTYNFIKNEEDSIFGASKSYLDRSIGLVVIAGKDYGMGSSRDWAAKGVKLLGVKAVIAESYERIHRSNLVMMGVVPLQFKNGENATVLGITGYETIDIVLPENFKPRDTIRVKTIDREGQEKFFEAILRFDSEIEISYLFKGGILNKVLDNIVNIQ